MRRKKYAKAKSSTQEATSSISALQKQLTLLRAIPERNTF